MSDFTVFLVDDDRAVLRSLDTLLRAEGYQTKVYCSAKTFLREHDGSIPGCVVLDLAMPEVDGLDVQAAFGHLDINEPIIFLTGEASIPDSVQAMKAGALDFLSKPVRASELLGAIKSAEVRDRAQRHAEAQRNLVFQKIARLTPREKQVLDHVVKGSLNKQISGALGIKEGTIKLHRGRMYEKMGARSVAELVRMTSDLNP